MKRIEEIDKNFAAADITDKDAHIKYFDVCKPPFEIYGVMPPNDTEKEFLRMPRAFAEGLNERIAELNTNTAGGRIRFRTNSSEIVLKAEMRYLARMAHFALTGSAGFDLYRVENGVQIYAGTFFPPIDAENGYSSVISLDSDGKEWDYVINMPLYSPVSRVYVGISENSDILPSTAKYRDIAPIVYYGSSITQGGCASRAGNAYQSVISRRLNIDFVNLGFSGNAKGEPEMADYIKKLEMSAFVYDYDNNAPDPEHLRLTHKPMFDAIRRENPKLPIVMVSRPRAVRTEDCAERLSIIEETYKSARAAGDECVYMLDGGQAMRDFCGNEGTVDNCHPNDLGFAALAKAMGDILENIFG